MSSDKKLITLKVGKCCNEDSQINVLARPDLKETVNPKYLFCDKCGRHWQKVVCYVGADLYVSHDWIPVPFPWESNNE